MLRYQQLSKEQVQKIYDTHMKKDFPPEEIKPLNVLYQLIEQGWYEAYGWFDEEEHFVAYTFFVRDAQGEILLLDYFAVCAAYRSQGYGSQCLSQMRELFSGVKGVLAEVEDPKQSRSQKEQMIRERRVAFYQRNGLRQTELCSALFGVPYILHYFSLEGDESEQQLLNALENIYRIMFSEMIPTEQVQLWSKKGDRVL